MKVKLEAAPPVNNVSLKASTADAGRVGNNICSIHVVRTVYVIMCPIYVT